jgi:nicotinamide mononucleotide transporter
MISIELARVKMCNGQPVELLENIVLLLTTDLRGVTIGMWFLRFQAGGEAGDLMILMWSLFLLNALFGYWRWHIGAKKGMPGESSVNNEEGKCDVG